MAGVAPNRRPLERARRWDGVVPIGEGLTPDGLRAYVGEDLPAGWDVVASDDGAHRPQEWAEAGATWLLQSADPGEDGWVEDLQARIRQGPPR